MNEARGEYTVADQIEVWCPEELIDKLGDEELVALAQALRVIETIAE